MITLKLKKKMNTIGIPLTTMQWAILESELINKSNIKEILEIYKSECITIGYKLCDENTTKKDLVETVMKLWEAIAAVNVRIK